MFAKLTGVVDTVYDDWFILDVAGVGYRVSASRKTLDLLERSLHHPSVLNPKVLSLNAGERTGERTAEKTGKKTGKKTGEKTGEKISFMIETQVREDAITLFGFLSLNDQKVFRLLVSVQGVGAKVALAVQSVLTAEQIKMALSAGDKGAISRATGVGPKLAQRIINELKDKAVHLSLSRINGFASGQTTSGLVTAGPESQTGGSDLNPADVNAGGDSLSGQEGPAAQEAVSFSMLDDITSALVNLGYRPMEAQGAAARAIQSCGEGASLGQLMPRALKELSQDVGR